MCAYILYTIVINIVLFSNVQRRTLKKISRAEAAEPPLPMHVVGVRNGYAVLPLEHAAHARNASGRRNASPRPGTARRTPGTRSAHPTAVTTACSRLQLHFLPNRTHARVPVFIHGPAANAPYARAYRDGLRIRSLSVLVIASTVQPLPCSSLPSKSHALTTVRLSLRPKCKAYRDHAKKNSISYKI